MTARSIPNLLGLFRIVTTPLLAALILVDTSLGYVSAVVLLLLMAISDIVDGRLARKMQVVSPLGVFLDTISDKIFVAGAVIPMVQLNLIPGWIALAIIARDFAVSGLRSYAAAEGQVISAREWGKQKLILTVTAIVWRLLDAALRGAAATPFQLSLDAGDPALILGTLTGFWPILIGLALIWTVGSGVEYFWKARRMLSDHWSPQPPERRADLAPPRKSSAK